MHRYANAGNPYWQWIWTTERLNSVAIFSSPKAIPPSQYGEMVLSRVGIIHDLWLAGSIGGLSKPPLTEVKQETTPYRYTKLIYTLNGKNWILLCWDMCKFHVFTAFSILPPLPSLLLVLCDSDVYEHWAQWQWDICGSQTSKNPPQGFFFLIVFLQFSECLIVKYVYRLIYDRLCSFLPCILSCLTHLVRFRLHRGCLHTAGYHFVFYSQWVLI